MLTNKLFLLILMSVLILFIVVFAAIIIVLVFALRKREPVIKVVMAPLAAEEPKPAPEVIEDEAADEEPEPEPEAEPELPVVEEQEEEVEEEEGDEDEEEDSTVYVTEGQERVRYDRSFKAKICQLKDETKEWYSELKNELLSYGRVKARISWKRESFRIGRMTAARLVVRGKTLCLMTAVEPSGYKGTKYTVEDVSQFATTADTPTLYRIKSARRLKYAKEMLAGMMHELKIEKNPQYETQNFCTAYESDTALIEQGLVKRIVTNSTRTIKMEEAPNDEVEAIIAEADKIANAQLEQASENSDKE